MVVKIYGVAPSSSTLLVLTTLKELGVPYEFLVIDWFGGEHKSPEYLETKNPFGQIPVLVDEDGFTLYESRAIARYLVAKYGRDSTLVPKDVKKNALFEQAASVESVDFDKYASGFAQGKVLKRLRGLQGSEERAAEYAAALEQKLQVYEKILGKQKYLAGMYEVTLADLFHLPFGSIIERAGFKGLTATPNLARWWKDISSRDSWKSGIAGAEEYFDKNPQVPRF